MPSHPSVQDVIEEIFQSILATPKKQRRLRSATFWEKLGFKVRTKERVEMVKTALHQRSLVTNFDDSNFGGEDKDEWIVISYIAPELPSGVIDHEQAPIIDIPIPDDAWFDLMTHRIFESEREVEYYFIVPLLEKLGYVEDDFVIGFPVQMYEGVNKVKKEADFVLFNGLSRDKNDALLVVEAKRTEKIIADDAVGQARAYAMWLSVPYYLVTNGEEIRVYLFRGAVQPDLMLMTFKRPELKNQWAPFYQAINKEAVIAYKAKLLAILANNGMN
jgi:hypothetical protein